MPDFSRHNEEAFDESHERTGLLLHEKIASINDSHFAIESTTQTDLYFGDVHTWVKGKLVALFRSICACMTFLRNTFSKRPWTMLGALTFSLLIFMLYSNRSASNGITLDLVELDLNRERPTNFDARTLLRETNWIAKILVKNSNFSALTLSKFNLTLFLSKDRRIPLGASPHNFDQCDESGPANAELCPTLYISGRSQSYILLGITMPVYEPSTHLPSIISECMIHPSVDLSLEARAIATPYFSIFPDQSIQMDSTSSVPCVIP